MSYRALKRWKSDTRPHAHIHSNASKKSHLDVLDYSEYSDTNISNFLFHENSFLCEEANIKYKFIYCNYN